MNIRLEKSVIERVAPPAAYELVVDSIKRAIHIGTYVPGDKLPPERVLAADLGVSRTTVREALRVLGGLGYIEIRRGATGGIIVSYQGQTEERWRPYVQQRMSELEELLDFREANECAAARLAAERRTQADLERLSAAHHVMEHGLETSRFRAADSAFHLGIADAAGNRYMQRAIEDARAAMWMPLDPLAQQLFRTADTHHARILEAIQSKNPEAAAQAMAEHIELVRDDLYRIAAGDD